MNSGDMRFKSARLTLEPFSAGHLGARHVGWLNDPEVVRYSEQRHRTHTLESCSQYLASFKGTPNLFYAILVSSQRPEHIGNINAYIDERNEIADIGILVGETMAKGKGYATEAWLSFCDFLFKEKRMRKITAGTIRPNKAMCKLMETTGMVPDGVRLRQYLWQGKAVDMLHAAFFREDWLLRHPEKLYTILL